MKIIDPSYEILTPIDRKSIYAMLEKAGRTCYKSEDKITEDSATKFVSMILNRNHESVIEHCVVSVRFICNRGFTHELVRHRLAAYSQESTRYCNYSKDKHNNELTVIRPPHFNTSADDLNKETLNTSSLMGDMTIGEIHGWMSQGRPGSPLPVEEEAWVIGRLLDEMEYMVKTIDLKVQAQNARGSLPIDIKTEIVITANLREWRHIFKLRTSAAAHPSMRQLMDPLQDEFAVAMPEIFGVTHE